MDSDYQLITVKTENETQTVPAHSSLPSTSTDVLERLSALPVQSSLPSTSADVLERLSASESAYNSIFFELQQTKDELKSCNNKNAKLKSNVSQLQSKLNLLHKRLGENEETIASLREENAVLKAHEHQRQESHRVLPAIENGNENKKSDVYEVEQILSDRKRRGVHFFLVKWKNYDETTWEPENNLFCPKILKAYLKSKK